MPYHKLYDKGYLGNPFGISGDHDVKKTRINTYDDDDDDDDDSNNVRKFQLSYSLHIQGRRMRSSEFGKLPANANICIRDAKILGDPILSDGCFVRKLPHVTLLALIILRRLADFWKTFASLIDIGSHDS